MKHLKMRETTRAANFTVVVNWMEQAFGCSKSCSYCSWRTSPYLPHGAQSKEAIVDFVSKCKKNFVTVSGGADPLFRFDTYGEKLLAMLVTIREQGFKTRVITREIARVAKLKGWVDCVSISLDPEVMAELPQHIAAWESMEVECSLVLPPLPTAEIVRLKPQYFALLRQLSTMGGIGNWCKRLVLRENLNSIFPLDMEQLSFGHAGIVFVPRTLCLGGRYLSTVDSNGYSLLHDNAVLAYSTETGHPNRRKLDRHSTPNWTLRA